MRDFYKLKTVALDAVSKGCTTLEAARIAGCGVSSVAKWAKAANMPIQPDKGGRRLGDTGTPAPRR